MMTPKERAAMQQALEALEQNTYYNFDDDIKALREALAEQAEQEPVTWYSVKGGFNNCGEGKPLYAAPVRTKDLTDDEKWAIFTSKDWTGEPLNLIDAVIAADREKNK